jgi:hypothetical protein
MVSPSHRFAVSAIAAMVLIPLACLGPPRVLPPNQVEDPNEGNLIGITTTSGDTVMFDETKPRSAAGVMVPAPHVVRDTVWAAVGGQPYKLPVSDVQRYWIRFPSTGRTVGLVAAVAGGTLIALGAIVAATKESCPFIYSWDGEGWVFDAEPYGGATTAGLARDDYGELEHLVAVDGEYRVLITNEVPETQYTDLVELWAVDHPAGTRVVADERGELQLLARPAPPLEARDESGRDLRGWLEASDRLSWEPAPDPAGTNDRGEITLTFAKPADAKRVILVADVATGIWGSYMIKAMLELHGNELDAWYAALDTQPAAVAALHAWNLREELYALKVLVEEPDGWKLGGVLPGGGPFLSEARAMALDVSRIPGRSFRIRVRPPRGFWSLNSFSVHAAAEGEMTIHRLAARSARDQDERDLLPALTSPDGSTYAMPSNDDRAVLTFPAPAPRAGAQRTVFVHAFGWYRIHLDDTRPPDREILRRIAEVPGAPARLAAERFAGWHLAAR